MVAGNTTALQQHPRCTSLEGVVIVQGAGCGAPEHGEDIVPYELFFEVIDEDLFDACSLCLGTCRLQLFSLTYG